MAEKGAGHGPWPSEKQVLSGGETETKNQRCVFDVLFLLVKALRGGGLTLSRDMQ